MQISSPSSSPIRQTARPPRLLATPLEVAPGFYFNLIAIWAGMSWLMGVKHPSWAWPKRIFSGALAGSALIFADVGHAFAHTFSARAAGAPVDQIQLSSGMPRTIYFDQSVTPRTHILRALGGPLFSAFGLVMSLVLRLLIPRNSISFEVAEWSSVGHGLIFAGSLAPLPVVDGGSILKWTLVESGKSPDEADQIVQQAGIATGFAATTAGAAFATRRKWLPAAGLLAAGLVAIAVAKGKIH